MDKVGVKLEEVKSSPLKAEPSPFNPTTDPERAMIRAMILDSYDWFKGLVEERRPLSKSQVAALADGSVFTGRQALQNKLVDELGGENEAVAWLATKGVDADLEGHRMEAARQRRLLPVLPGDGNAGAIPGHSGRKRCDFGRSRHGALVP